MSEPGDAPLTQDDREQATRRPDALIQPIGYRAKADEWARQESGRHLCQCGCGGVIPVRWMHRYIGVPTHLRGHAQWKKPGAAVAREFIAANQGKHKCRCGCGKLIVIKRHHHIRGVPSYISGHGRGNSPRFSAEEAAKRDKESKRRSYERYRLANGIQPRKPAMTVEERKARNQEKYLANREKYRQLSGEYAKSHRQEAVERARQWAKDNPEKAHANRFKYKQRRKGSEGSFTATEWKALKKKYNHRCLKCGRREPEIVLRPDHVVPVTKGGTSFIDNIQPLCHGCNCAKGNRNTIDYRLPENRFHEPE